MAEQRDPVVRVRFDFETPSVEEFVETEQPGDTPITRAALGLRDAIRGGGPSGAGPSAVDYWEQPDNRTRWKTALTSGRANLPCRRAR